MSARMSTGGVFDRLLRGDVVGRADDRAPLSSISVSLSSAFSNDRASPMSRILTAPAGVAHQVGRLDVAVDEPLLVGVLQAGRRLRDALDGRGVGHGPVAVEQPAARVSPSTYSMTRYVDSPCRATSRMRTMFGWSRAAAARASRRNRSWASFASASFRAQHLHRHLPAQRPRARPGTRPPCRRGRSGRAPRTSRAGTRGSRPGAAAAPGSG